jgi:Intu longin-like domain 3
MISNEIHENSLQFTQNVPVKTPQTDEATQEKYIYFNHKNNRFHACLYDNDNATSHREGKKTQISSSVMNLLCDLYAKEEEDVNKVALINNEKETIIKTFNDYWLCSRTYNNRSLYLILHKSSTLIDIAEESQKLMAEIVKNVYFTNQQ